MKHINKQKNKLDMSKCMPSLFSLMNVAQGISEVYPHFQLPYLVLI